MTRSRMPTPRRGAALVLALVIMATLSTILAVLAVEIFSQRQQATRRQHQLQALWLARAGVELAAARLLDKPAPFTDDRQGLVADGRLRVVVEKTGADIYSVTAEAEVGREAEVPVTGTAAARFRRSVAGGAVRLTALSPAQTKAP